MQTPSHTFSIMRESQKLFQSQTTCRDQPPSLTPVTGPFPVWSAYTELTGSSEISHLLFSNVSEEAPQLALLLMQHGSLTVFHSGCSRFGWRTDMITCGVQKARTEFVKTVHRKRKRATKAQHLIRYLSFLTWLRINKLYKLKSKSANGCFSVRCPC